MRHNCSDQQASLQAVTGSVLSTPHMHLGLHARFGKRLLISSLN